MNDFDRDLPTEVHPPSIAMKLARRLRLIRRVPLGSRLLDMFAAGATQGPFCIRNLAPGGGELIFSGDVGSFLDRQVYLAGGYEQQRTALFLARVPKHRRRTVLDIGANAGTHALTFARHFQSVHAFEPNPLLWNSFERNQRLNGFTNVHLHRVGLADQDAILPFHLIDRDNYGLGTFSKVKQYDLPLKEVCRAKVVIGDRYLPELNVTNVDAVKIDVQGYEPDVLRGLRETLERDRPLVWCEIGSGTVAKVETLSDLCDFFPESYVVERFTDVFRWAVRTVKLLPVPDGVLKNADYLVVPSELATK